MKLKTLKDIHWFRWLITILELGVIGLAVYLNYIGIYPR